MPTDRPGGGDARLPLFYSYEKLKKLLARVEHRLQKKIERAEQAFIRQSTLKKPEHCTHLGRRLGEDTHICLIQCVGQFESEAFICYPDKARGCEGLELREPVDAVRKRFRNFSDDEIRLRWPSVGELLWIRKEITALMREIDSENP